MNRLAIIFVFLFAIGTSACSSAWSDAELRSVENYCDATAGDHNGSCASWIDGIHRLSNCDMDQAKRVIDRVVAEYNGAPEVSIAEGYQAVGCEYGER